MGKTILAFIPSRKFEMNKALETLATLISLIVICVPWLMGLVIAKGWDAFFAICPPYAWYILTEYLMKLYKLI